MSVSLLWLETNGSACDIDCFQGNDRRIWLDSNWAAMKRPGERGRPASTCIQERAAPGHSSPSRSMVEGLNLRQLTSEGG